MNIFLFGADSLFVGGVIFAYSMVYIGWMFDKDVDVDAKVITTSAIMFVIYLFWRLYA